MLNYKIIYINNNNIIKLNNNINIIYYLILDKKNFDYIYIYYNMNINKIIKFIYILNTIYIFFINNNIVYLLFKIYKHIFYNNLKIKKYQINLNIIGINYKFYYIKKYNILIFKLKYNHKIIIKLPNLIFCEINISKNIICLYSLNLFLLNFISELINSFQYINKYKELGIKKVII
ncbi:apicoplast ribosomal protein L6, putative (apicoplast) [Plasmodium ovale]|uniref:Apicoplast ribosomal protein L6, putative n=1 Tax=Plasmodium ovale TaxID=36330 RepID=H7CDC3_PLAOA|nr:large subunit ribosomal protein 6 [Plasmodium ovale]SCQ17337.1 apicoplast ribosomal protein L6, putative [Plasmodium ovale]